MCGIRATVQYKLEDYFTFSEYDRLGENHAIQPTAIGNRLEKNGFLQPFNVIMIGTEIETYRFWG